MDGCGERALVYEIAELSRASLARPEQCSYPGCVIPVIDLFAGPGGLGEGFSSLRCEANEHAFKIALSVEMERNARETLKLRSFYRQFERDEVPEAYYQCLSGTITRAELYADPRYQNQSAAADREAMCAELGSDDEKIDLAIRTSLIAQGIELKKAPGKRRPWVLIGGPPCQAYSLVGRSRMRGADPRMYVKDPRHKL
jgi:DNA (cytosine-5)-methyltransferase 1